MAARRLVPIPGRLLLHGLDAIAAPRIVPLPGRLLIGASMTRLDAMAAPRLIPLPGRLLHFPRRRQEELF
jgi:hypothetical protein